MKTITGFQAKGIHAVGRPVLCEVLEADGDRIRTRTTFQDTGEVFENLQAPENPRVFHEGYKEIHEQEGTVYEGHWQCRTWRNGDELPIEKAQGWNFQDLALCTVLHKVYGEAFTGYEHNYVYRNGQAFEAD